MKFYETDLSGAWLVEPERFDDERGFFARTWCHQEFADRGLNPALVQCNVSFNNRSGTLRGMHYQTAPWEEAKLVRCTAGSIHDVIIDLRLDSPTYLQSAGFELTQENRLALYVPEGFAHGFQTLRDKSEVFYQMSETYHGDCAAGVRWNDPAFAISWPLPVSVISVRDNSYPDYVAST